MNSFFRKITFGWRIAYRASFLIWKDLMFAQPTEDFYFFDGQRLSKLELVKLQRQIFWDFLGKW